MDDVRISNRREPASRAERRRQRASLKWLDKTVQEPKGTRARRKKRRKVSNKQRRITRGG